MGDRRLSGSLLAIRYNNKKGTIDIHDVAYTASFTPSVWSVNPDIETADFVATQTLSQRPILSLGPPRSPMDSFTDSEISDAVEGRRNEEHPVAYVSGLMMSGRQPTRDDDIVDDTLVSFFRCVKIVQPHRLIECWPDYKFPYAKDRTRNVSRHPSRISTPINEEAASVDTFRIHRRSVFRSAMEFYRSLFDAVANTLQTEVEYFARLDHRLYQPSKYYIVKIY